MNVTVETLGEAEKPWVWRCHQCTLAFVDGAWHRMDKAQWIPLTVMPPGPFHRIDNPVFSDYRTRIVGHGNLRKAAGL
jgi:hypothetical protein